jgi:two-component system, LuxR family, response regulator FixJ
MARQPNPTILIVDDDDVVRDSVRALLESRGYAVADFESAECFLRDRAGYPGDCLILDLHMPSMTGMELLRSLRAKRDPIPVILVTGRREASAPAEAAALGAVEFLDKPVTHRTLFQAIEKALGAGSARA